MPDFKPLPIANLSEMKDGDPLTGVALIIDAEIRDTRKGSQFLRGTLRNAEGISGYKIWGSNWLDSLLSSNRDISGLAWDISGKVNEYNGTSEVIIESMTEAKGIKPLDLIDSPYDPKAVFKEADTILRSNLTIEAQRVLALLLNTEVMQRFILETAALTSHDSVKHGLLAHSTKTLRVLDFVLENYKNLSQSGKVDTDLLYLGAFIHDIGKIYEYHNLGKGERYWVSHHVWAVQYIAGYKDQIIALKGEDFYFGLLTIMTQHHGKYGEAPRTVAAYLIHLADMVEGKITVLNNAILSSEPSIRVDGFNLY